MITGPAWSKGFQHAGDPGAARDMAVLADWAQEPTVAQVSTMVPEST